jgi:hypothetical protein
MSVDLGIRVYVHDYCLARPASSSVPKSDLVFTKSGSSAWNRDVCSSSSTKLRDKVDRSLRAFLQDTSRGLDDAKARLKTLLFPPDGRRLFFWLCYYQKQSRLDAYVGEGEAIKPSTPLLAALSYTYAQFTENVL